MVGHTDIVRARIWTIQWSHWYPWYGDLHLGGENLIYERYHRADQKFLARTADIS